jgi:hypothetical protein
MAIGAPANVMICTVAENPCQLLNQAVAQAYLIDPSYQSQTEMMLAQSGVDWQSVYDAFTYSLLLFAVGISVGIIVNLVKKAR